MNELPDYVNCNNREVEVCHWYMHKNCKEKCAYAMEIKGLGVGAMTVPPKRTMTKDLIDKLFREDMRDY